MRWCTILLVGVGLASAQYNEPVCEDLLEGARLGLGAMVKLVLTQETLQMEYQQSRDDLQRQMHATLLNLLQLLADVPAAPSYVPPPPQYGTLPPSFYPIPPSTASSYRPPTTPSSYQPPTTPSSGYQPRTTPSYSTTTLNTPLYPATSTRYTTTLKYFGYGTTSTTEIPQELPGYQL